MYSLVSASVLALDLVRHPSGTAVADVVDRLLALQPAELAALAAAPSAPTADRARVLAACAAEPRMDSLLRDVRRRFAEGLPAPAETRTMVQAMGGTLLGGLSDLHDLLRREPPLAGAPEPAVTAALDAVTVAWAGRAPGVELSALARLRAPWAGALAPLPPPLPDAGYGPRGRTALGALLEELPRLHQAAWDRVEQAHGAGRGTLSWSTAMHAACRLAVEHDRVVPVARAHLAAARALRLAGVSATPAAQPVAMAVTAAVQALAVRDVLAPDTAAVLLTGWQARQA